MKVPTAILAALLLMAICSSAEPKYSDFHDDVLSSDMNTCCMTLTRRRIPSSVVASAYRTSSKRPIPAVVLVTKKGIHICANPEQSWVQEYLKQL